MRVLVLGGYGFIGAAICRELIARGHEVTGLGRSPRTGRSLLPQADWIGADLTRLTTPEDWAPLLKGFDTVVNAAGVLQAGARDDVKAVQETAMIALYKACAAQGPRRVIQISAPGAHPTSTTAFYRTKARADAALMESGLAWTVLRPGLVIAEDSYGGTALLRLLAAIPLVQPLTLAEATVQTVNRSDVATVAADATEGAHVGEVLDLVASTPHTLEDILLATRRWLGFRRPLMVLRLPVALARPAAMGGDIAGLLGWRPALRTTALKVLKDGVEGDPAAYEASAGRPLMSLKETLASLPGAGRQAREARLMLLMPLVLILFSLFWIASGLVGMARIEAASAVLAGRIPVALAKAFVIGGSLVDIAVGLALLVRRTARAACLAALFVSLGYLAAATLVVPDLWADPLGPLTKILPVLATALVLHELIGGGRDAAR